MLSANIDRHKKPEFEKKSCFADLIVDVPRILRSECTKYEFVQLIGSGSYGKCFEVKDKASGERFACKILSQTLLNDKDNKQMVRNEITIHRRLQHGNIVKFVESFSDANNIYMIQSLCSNFSLANLLKQRGTVTLFECRYILNQILHGAHYIHEKGLIHRDLKVANILITDDMQMKIGDFGLVIRVENAPKEANILCGTTNYLAPEVIQLIGYKRRSDVWAIGVIAFILLFGYKPFEEKYIHETMYRIKRADYRLAPQTDYEFQILLRGIFEKDFTYRLTAEECLKTAFFVKHNIPNNLPTETMWKPSVSVPSQTKSLRIENPGCLEQSVERPAIKYPEIQILAEPNIYDSVENSKMWKMLEPIFEHFDSICQFHTSNNDTSITNLHHQFDLQPNYWIVKWSYDETLIHGFAYQLSDASIGTLFLDGMQILQAPNGNLLFEITDGGLQRLTTNPTGLDTQEYLRKFNEFQNRLKKSGHFEVATSYNQRNLPHLITWFHTDETMVMLLSNCTVQINFLTTHKKVVICAKNKSITFVNNFICPDNFKTVSFDFIAAHQFSQQDFVMFKYVTAILKNLIDSLKV